MRTYKLWARVVGECASCSEARSWRAVAEADTRRELARLLLLAVCTPDEVVDENAVDESVQECRREADREYAANGHKLSGEQAFRLARGLELNRWTNPEEAGEVWRATPPRFRVQVYSAQRQIIFSRRPAACEALRRPLRSVRTPRRSSRRVTRSRARSPARQDDGPLPPHLGSRARSGVAA